MPREGGKLKMSRKEKKEASKQAYKNSAFYRERIYPDKVIIKRLLKYLDPYKSDAKTLVFLTVLNALLGLAFPLGINFILQYLDKGEKNKLLLLGTILIVIEAIRFFTTITYNYKIAKMSQIILMDLRQDTFSHVQLLSVSFHTKEPSGILISKLTNDVGAIQTLLSNQLINFVANLLITIVNFILILYLSWELTLIVACLIPLIFKLFMFVARKNRPYVRAQREKISEITRTLQENITGVRTVKAFVKEKSNILDFDRKNRENRDVGFKSAKVSAMLEPIKALVISIGIGSVVAAGVMLINNDLITIIQLLTYILLLLSFFGPANSLGEFYNTIQPSLAAGDRILEILDTECKIKDKENAYELPPVTQGIVEFKDVNFQYVEDVQVLKGINFKTTPKSRYAFVGFTGAGKTTLVSLLNRFYDPTMGEIFVDGHNIKDVTLESLRNQIGVVLQDTFLFAGTIMDNIRYGKLDATDEEVYEASKKVGAHPFILDLPEGYDTNIKERGSLLSIGQRQLISFARALLSDPPILIMDEATSSVDPYTELKIQEALEVLLEKRTSFIIAHRLSTILNSDVICVMEDGVISQRGSHDSLIKQGGLYKYLYQLQFKENKSKGKDSGFNEIKEKRKNT